MNNYSVLVADSGETSRKHIYSLLMKRGYKLYQATDGAGTIRIARSINPDLIIMDIDLWGCNAHEVARIIEEDRLSTVLFITNSVNKINNEMLKQMNIYAYLLKPINQEQLYQMVEFSIFNSKKISSLSKKIEKLESSLEGRKKVDKAKGILMDKLKVTENEAYMILRRRSMDKCKSMEEVADEIIKG